MYITSEMASFPCMILCFEIDAFSLLNTAKYQAKTIHVGQYTTLQAYLLEYSYYYCVQIILLVLYYIHLVSFTHDCDSLWAQREYIMFEMELKNHRLWVH